MARFKGLMVSLPFGFLLFICSTFIIVPGVIGWSKEGHEMTCLIAQALLKPEASEAVKHLLPPNVNGNLSALCVWPDQIRHWYKYRWTSPLHFIDTPDDKCGFQYSRDCHEDQCVAGAIKNFTSQLSHYKEGTSDRRYNMTEALLFLAHFTGDIHQVWDREIILTALADYYDKDVTLLLQDIEKNYTNGIWSDDVVSWEHCNDISRCVNNWAKESIQIACKWGYEGVKSGTTLAEDYFDSRMPYVMKRIAQGGIRLAMMLNQVFGDSEEGFVAAT
ncbi:unnamed protein product [Trifolium pratense]|uniref:Uncharacterized protein n=1 Tax=Trifolium pratense TaxID=57577 RepID=A0ACB0JWM5_TRIPR|nr:unnamed protein product [Trifolium pratense]